MQQTLWLSQARLWSLELKHTVLVWGLRSAVSQRLAGGWWVIEHRLIGPILFQPIRAWQGPVVKVEVEVQLLHTSTLSVIGLPVSFRSVTVKWGPAPPYLILVFCLKEQWSGANVSSSIVLWVKHTDVLPINPTVWAVSPVSIKTRVPLCAKCEGQ